MVSTPQIDMFQPGVLIHGEDDRICEVVDLQELPQRRAGAPGPQTTSAASQALTSWNLRMSAGQDVGVLH
jgi:hypothetical protein